MGAINGILMGVYAVVLAAVFFIHFFLNFSRVGGGSDLIILFMSFFVFLFIYLYLFIPLTCIRHIYKTSVTTQTTVNSEVYANRVERHICDLKIRD